MNIKNAATLEAAEEFVVWLRQAGDYSDADLAEAMQFITAAAGCHKFGIAMMGLACGDIDIRLKLIEVPPF